MRPFVLSFLVALPLLAGCAAGDGEEGAGFAVRDSAGIRIVENHRARWREGERWSVEAEPALQLGVVEGAPEQMFARVVDALRLRDGTIVVADDGNTDLRFFDGEGRFLRRVGREGKGPGEFEGIAQLASCGGDSVIAWDPWLRRASTFDAQGELGRSFALEGPPPSQSVYGRWACGERGEVVLTGWPRTDGIPQGLHRPSMPVALTSIADGRITASLGEVAGDDRYGTPNGSGPAPLGRRTSVAMGVGRAYVGTSDSYELRGYRLDGILELLLRRPNAVRAVTREDLARYREAELARLSDPDLRRQRERTLLDMEFPTTFPAYAALRTDFDGHLWVQSYPRPGEYGAEWAVFEPDGEWLGEVLMPEGLEVYEVGRDYVLGRWRDDLGVNYVRVHRLRKPEW